ncbi:hypothetical protein [Parabacteroides chongii]
MKTIHYSTKAKKDLKKYRSNIKLMEALFNVLNKLERGNPFQASTSPMSS